MAQHAWRLSGRVVSGFGQLLLWLVSGLGRLLRPLVRNVATRLNGTSPAPGAPPGATPGRDGHTRVGSGGPVTAPLPRWIGTWRHFQSSWYFAPLTGLLLTLTALAELAARDRELVSVAGGFALASTLPLVWRREILRPVAAMVLGATAASLLSGQILLVTTAFAALYTLSTLARHLPKQSVGVLAIGSLVSVGVVYVATGSLDHVPWLVTLLAVLAAIGLGDARRVVETAERTHAEARELTSETLTRLTMVQREQAVMRERARIARELHDVVAHSVSMIAVQAETAPYTMRRLSPEAEQGYAEIARTAREALVEMRRLLGVLRADSQEEPESAPQPRLDRLPELIEQHRGAGGKVDMAVRGDPRSLSTTVELSAYRIVQEALTNARRHAPGADVRIELSYLPDRLAVRVVDSGPTAPTMVLDPRRNPAMPGYPGEVPPYGGFPGGESSQSAVPGDPSEGQGGHGLVGMRERATMLGGRFAAGPATGGGFMVEAELPVTRVGDPPPAHTRADRR